ncbi:hypothetical protein JTB14_015698 [Gonioctena quinquepunctata]|nr:hypothetical protein JTB14_015698 [Gonioctena quinquepunctata]
MLHNTGQSLVFRVDKDTKQHVNISGGPLAYRYQFEEIYIHYGIDNRGGSEHQIQGYSFPSEIQLYGFNKELYHNMSEAQHKSQGVVAVSLMVQIGDTPNPELRIITSVFNKVQYKEECDAIAADSANPVETMSADGSHDCEKATSPPLSVGSCVIIISLHCSARMSCF